jgi:beta-glucosidase
MTKEDVEAAARSLLALLNPAEKAAMMSGSTFTYPGLLDMVSGGYSKHTWDAGALERLGIEGIKFVDGPRGVVISGTTTFPVSMARGATWDVELEERIGDAIGKEAQALGANLFGGVCINILRHPAWGRAQETYGEDPFHVGEMGAALTCGVQRHMMACAKHFALNSMENARFTVDVTAGRRAMHEIYLKAFKRVVDEGIACVMSAYNSVNGQWCGQSAELLNGILKTRWKFDGFVITDFVFGLRDGKTAILAGQDVEMPFPMQMAPNIEKLIEAGEVAQSRIDDAALRLLRQQLRFKDREHLAFSANEHYALAREAAQKSIVLLKNEGLLPLGKPKSLAIIGKLAAQPNTGDGGSSNTKPEYVVTPLDGIRKAFEGECGVNYDDGNDLVRARSIAASAETVLLVVGYTHEDEGEFISPVMGDGLRSLFPRPRFRDIPTLFKLGWRTRKNKSGTFTGGGDRTSLTLSEQDERLIEEIAAVHSRCVVLVMAGSAVIMERWRDKVAAILMLWYPGMEGGHAMADVLTGRVNASGRLPFVIPKHAEDLPFFDMNACAITYDHWHGYRKLEKDSTEPAFPFGFGMSYTKFTWSEFEIRLVGDVLQASVTVSNCGPVNGDEVVQLYVRALSSTVERPLRELVGFARVTLSPTERKDVSIRIPISRLAYFDEAKDDLVVEAIEYEFLAARHSLAADALSVRLRLSLEDLR